MVRHGSVRNVREVRFDGMQDPRVPVETARCDTGKCCEFAGALNQPPTSGHIMKNFHDSVSPTERQPTEHVPNEVK
jgi:hypothetical protein